MTMNDIGLNRINYLAVVVAAAAVMAIGFVWYSPLLFGPAWLELAGITPGEAAAGMGAAYAKGSVVALVSALFLALLMDWVKAGGWRCGVLVALAVWLGFVVTTRAYGVIFAGHPMGLLWINAGHELVSYAAMGAIIGGWPKKPA